MAFVPNRCAASAAADLLAPTAVGVDQTAAVNQRNLCSSVSNSCGSGSIRGLENLDIAQFLEKNGPSVRFSNNEK